MPIRQIVSIIGRFVTLSSGRTYVRHEVAVFEYTSLSRIKIPQPPGCATLKARKFLPETYLTRLVTALLEQLRLTRRNRITLNVAELGGSEEVSERGEGATWASSRQSVEVAGTVLMI